jgi:hypothetical protein
MMTNLQVATALTSPLTPTTAEVVYSSQSATPNASKRRQYAMLFKDKIRMNETYLVKFHRRSGFSLLIRGENNAPESVVYHCSLDHHSMKVAFFFYGSIVMMILLYLRQNARVNSVPDFRFALESNLCPPPMNPLRNHKRHHHQHKSPTRCIARATLL